MSISFEDALHQGQIGESLIARWVRRNGWHVLPVYEKEIDNGKGPRLFMASGSADSQLIAPDMLAMRNGSFMWIEAKHKKRFSWYGKGQHFCTGIDKRHFDDYCKVARSTNLPIWILFLHSCGETWRPDVEKWGAPAECPTGLFGAEISVMEKTARFHHAHGPTGMYYWQMEALQLLAVLSEVMPRAHRVAA